MNMKMPAPVAFRPRLQRHLKELTRLAVPMILARSGMTVMIAVDTVMVGRYAAEDLAYLGLANALLFTVMIGAVGLLIGTVASTARAHGAGDTELGGEIFRRGVRYALLLGAAAMLLMVWSEPLFGLATTDHDMVDGAASATRVFALGLPGATLFMVATFFLEGLKRPRPAMILMVAANLLNVLLNWLLVYGNWGLPALGADGSALASSILRWTMAGGLIAYIVWLLPNRQAYGLYRPRPGSWARAAGERRLGYANGVSQLAEAAAFSAMTLYASVLGVVAVGVYAINLSVLGMLFMVGLGIGFATAVRVGYAIGHGEGSETAFVGWTGLAANTVVCLVLALVVVTPFAGLIAAFYSHDATLISATTPLLILTAFAVVFDGGQGVMATTLRAMHDTWVPTLCHLISYVLIMLPLGWVLAITLERGVRGLIEAIILASVISVGLLSARFFMLSRRVAEGSAKSA